MILNPSFFLRKSLSEGEVFSFDGNDPVEGVGTGTQSLLLPQDLKEVPIKEETSLSFKDIFSIRRRFVLKV